MESEDPCTPGLGHCRYHSAERRTWNKQCYENITFVRANREVWRRKMLRRTSDEAVPNLRKFARAASRISVD